MNFTRGLKSKLYQKLLVPDGFDLIVGVRCLKERLTLWIQLGQDLIKKLQFTQKLGRVIKKMNVQVAEVQLIKIPQMKNDTVLR